MSELRYDIATGDWVVFAPSRALRPHGPTDKKPSAQAAASSAACPFCPGNESLTPREIYSVRDAAGKWRVRVVPNKFPALRIEENNQRHEEGVTFRAMGGCGAHEVIVESPDHSTVLAREPLDQITAVLETLRLRAQDLMRDRRFQTIIIFKNHGETAGTSLAHPHWQLIATPVVPRVHRQKHQVATDYFDRTGHCLYCIMLNEELAAGRRILAQNDDYVALLPYASHTPFETWILPRRHQPSFTEVEPAKLRSLAQLLKSVLLTLYTGLDNPDFNLAIDTAPRGDEDKEYFLWHLRIIPRLTTPAGFELGSGMSINTVMPEEATAFLHQVGTAASQQ